MQCTLIKQMDIDPLLYPNLNGVNQASFPQGHPGGVFKMRYLGCRTT